MNLFYHHGISLGGTIWVESAEAVHITKVLRKKDGDTISITDGMGNLFAATLRTDGKKTSLTIDKLERTESENHLLEIAVCPTKNNERLEWFVEKAVEIGIGKISLIQAEHSERVHVKHERLMRVAVSAMKQSLKLRLPEICEVQSFSSWIKNASAEIKCIAHCDEGEKTLLKNALAKGKTACIAIGPEGDFSKKEIALAQENGFISVSLGSSRLRTETAALAAVHTFEIINQ